MLPGYRDVSNILTQLGNKGQAIVRINLVAYANDPNFRDDPPSSSVTVTVMDPAHEGLPVLVASADIPTTTPPFQYEFVIPVEKTVNVLKGMLLRTQPRALSVRVVATPISGFEERYEPAQHTLDNIQAGTILWKSVALKPKKSAGQGSSAGPD